MRAYIHDYTNVQTDLGPLPEFNIMALKGLKPKNFQASCVFCKTPQTVHEVLSVLRQ